MARWPSSEHPVGKGSPQSLTPQISGAASPNVPGHQGAGHKAHRGGVLLGRRIARDEVVDGRLKGRQRRHKALVGGRKDGVRALRLIQKVVELAELQQGAGEKETPMLVYAWGEDGCLCNACPAPGACRCAAPQPVAAHSFSHRKYSPMACKIKENIHQDPGSSEPRRRR